MILKSVNKETALESLSCFQDTVTSYKMRLRFLRRGGSLKVLYEMHKLQKIIDELLLH